MRHYKLNSLPKNYLLLMCILIWLNHDISWSWLLGIKKKNQLSLIIFFNLRIIYYSSKSFPSWEWTWLSFFIFFDHHRSWKFKQKWFFNWSIADLKCFRCTAKWFIYIYTHTYFRFFPLQVITRYWVQFLVLYSRPLLLIYFICSSVYL